MFATVTGTGSGTAPVVSITFPYIDKSHVKAAVDGSAVSLTWTNTSQVTFQAPVPSGASWKVYRETPTNPAVVDYTDSSLFTSDNLNLSDLSHRYRDEELADLVTLVDSVRDAAISIETENREAADAAIQSSLSAAVADEAAKRDAADAAILGSLPGIPANATLNAASRAIMAGLGTSLPVVLTELGREGTFNFSSTNLSAHVTADPNQGLYVPPSSDPTGASGAWVREFNGPALSTWFGVSTAAPAATNVAAFNAALATLKTLAVTGTGFNSGSIGLHTPAGHYQFNATLRPAHQLAITGDYRGSGGGTVFEWVSNTHGFEALGGVGQANGTMIFGFYLLGTGAGSAIHAIHQTGNLTVDTCFFDRWSGDGVHADSTTGGLSGSTWRHLSGQAIGWTVSIDGPDSNGCLLEKIGAADNRFGGVRDSGGIGNVVVGGVINRCGLTPGFITRCEKNGHIYTVAPDQEAWCNANPPSGDTSNNQGWFYLGEGVASSTQPEWTAGQDWYFSSPVYVEATDGNVRTVFLGMYIEAGLNSVILNDPSQIIGGQILVPVLNQFGTKHGGYIHADRYYTLFNNGLKTFGDILVEAPGSGLWINDVKVVGARDTGWASDLGTARKSSNTTYVAVTAPAAYDQALMQQLMNAEQVSQESIAAIKNALIAHGLLG